MPIHSKLDRYPQTQKSRPPGFPSERHYVDIPTVSAAPAALLSMQAVKCGYRDHHPNGGPAGAHAQEYMIVPPPAFLVLVIPVTEDIEMAVEMTPKDGPPQRSPDTSQTMAEEWRKNKSAFVARTAVFSAEDRS
jgi:hypothetical protein